MIIKSDSGKVLLETSECIIWVPFNRTRYNEFHFELSHFWYDCPIRGMRLPHYMLVPTTLPNDRNSFHAYFCNMSEDTTRTVLMGKDWDYFFTATLSGCSIGIGKQDRLGRTMVGHANAGARALDFKHLLGSPSTDAVLGMAQEIKQEKMLKTLGLRTILGPTIYGHSLESKEDLNTTLIGFRDKQSGRWSFIRQTYNERYLLRPRQRARRSIQ